MEFKFQVQLKIRKPPAEVFDAVVNQEKMTRYFIDSASGPLVAGKTVKWEFAEVPDEPFDVIVDEVVENERVVFRWPTHTGKELTRVQINFLPLDDGATMVQISETEWPQTPEGQANSYDNAGGWMHMLCCLKAYLEYDINLRAGGAF